MMANGAIDLDEIATPEIPDPRQVEELHPGLSSRKVLAAIAGSSTSGIKCSARTHREHPGV
jgi:hypothetical protein